MPLFRKLPVEVEAVQLPVQRFGDDAPDWVKRARTEQRLLFGWISRTWKIRTLEGEMEAHPGDWLVQGVAGELYAVRREVFEATYVLAGECPAADRPPDDPTRPFTPTAAGKCANPYCADVANCSVCGKRAPRDLSHCPDADGGY